MSDTIAKHRASRDGASLKALALEGDHDAALAYAQLVFDGKYAGETTVHVGDSAVTRTKKEAKELAREDAFHLVKATAEAGHFEGCLLWCEAHFYGVREPGHFGSTLMTPLYGEAETLYQVLLDHPECPDSKRGEFLIHKAQSIIFKSRIKGLDRNEEIIGIFHEVIDSGCAEASMAHFNLSDLMWKLGRYEEAVKHAEFAKEDFPYAYLTLSMAYKSGKGVDQDSNLAKKNYDLWDVKTARKSKSKK